MSTPCWARPSWNGFTGLLCSRGGQAWLKNFFPSDCSPDGSSGPWLVLTRRGAKSQQETVSARGRRGKFRDAQFWQIAKWNVLWGQSVTRWAALCETQVASSPARGAKNGIGETQRGLVRGITKEMRL